MASSNSSRTFLNATKNCFVLCWSSIIFLFLIIQFSSAQPAAWPSTSYSPYFQSLFSVANSPVAALPSGAGAQAPAIPVTGGAAAGPMAYGGGIV